MSDYEKIKALASMARDGWQGRVLSGMNGVDSVFDLAALGVATVVMVELLISRTDHPSAGTREIAARALLAIPDIKDVLEIVVRSESDETVRRALWELMS